MHRAVFVDRDGTLNEDPGYIRGPELFELLPGVPEAIRLLNSAGYLVVVVTNQSGVARGFFNERDLDAIHKKLRQEVSRDGGRVDAVYHCPHHPTAGTGPLTRDCFCRKPAPGMIYQAALDLKIDIGRSFLVGDGPGDVEAGRRSGCKTVLVMTGRGRETAETLARTGGPSPNRIASNLREAAVFISECGRGGSLPLDNSHKG